MPGPYEANNEDELVSAMMPSFDIWAKKELESLDLDEEDLEGIKEEMIIQFVEGLEEVKENEHLIRT